MQHKSEQMLNAKLEPTFDEKKKKMNGAVVIVLMEGIFQKD